MPHAETDLEGPRGLTSEYLVEVEPAVAQLQAEPGPTQLQPALLAEGGAPGSHHKALDGAHARRSVSRLLRLLGFIGHERHPEMNEADSTVGFRVKHRQCARTAEGSADQPSSGDEALA